MICPQVILITLLIFTSELVNGLIKMNINHRPQQQDQSFFNLSGAKGNWIEQPLDHFDSNEKRTFKMRYTELPNHWKPNGPIYVYLTSDRYGAINILPHNFMNEMAVDTNGVLFVLEYRYYGVSHPRMTRRNLMEYYKFLSSKQALADLAHFIKTIKADPKYKWSKVVVMGAGLAGNIAAWSRSQYPELVDAALAASAPVLAKKDFHEYYDGIRYIYEKYGTENCLKHVTNKFMKYQELLRSKNYDTLKEELDICSWVDLTILENQQFLFEWLFIDLSSVAEGTPQYVKAHCKSITTGDGKLWSHRSDSLNQMKFLSRHKDDHCLPLNISPFWYTSPEWYQFCTEYGYFKTTSSEIQPFVYSNPLEYFFKKCESIIDRDIEKRIDEGVARTNEMFGGRSPNVTKVVFTHGDMDPWHRLGVLRDLGPDAPVLIANGSSHAAIIMHYYENSKELTEQRKRTKALIKKWISEA